MTREIKFRAWNWKTKAMFYDDTIGNLCISDLSNGLFDEIMQYTGLKDKNGKDIYEGDIINFRTNYCIREKCLGYTNGLVIYDNSSARYQFKVGDFFYVINEEMEHTSLSEVVGNIYENQELLK